MAFAEIYNKGGTDRTVILNVRTALLQGFQAPNWMDLRFGWFVSLTQNAADDTITGLAEERGTPPRPEMEWTDRYAIGLCDRRQTIFLGYTNDARPASPHSIGTSKLVSSDIGIGTTNSNYWRCKNERSDDWTAAIIDGRVNQAVNHGGFQPHFAQANIGAGGPAGYALLMMLRFRRDTPTSRVIRMEMPSSLVLFSSAAGNAMSDIIQTNLAAWPASQTIGPVELSVIPDSMYLFWPFTLSRLRLHDCGFLRSG